MQPALLRALGHGGNYLVGAYRVDTGELVGASVAFFTEPLGAAMHSHITGVLAGTAGRGVGAALKWHQRQWALERGLTRITWTFDPLIARNSYFNLTRLGARAGNLLRRFLRPDERRTQPRPAHRPGAGRLGPAPDLRRARPGRPSGDGPESRAADGGAVLLSVGTDGAAGRRSSDARRRRSGTDRHSGRHRGDPPDRAGNGPGLAVRAARRAGVADGRHALADHGFRRLPGCVPAGMRPNDDCRPLPSARGADHEDHRGGTAHHQDAVE